VDYGRPELASRLAAEYVLGTLQRAARRRFETLLPSHPRLRDAVRQWEERLAPLADAVPMAEPSDRVWAGVQQRLFEGRDEPRADAAAAAAALPWWRRLGLWQSWSAAATAAAVLLAWTLSQAPPPQPPIVVVLSANPDAGGQAISARFVAGISRDGSALVLRPVGPVALAAGRALELWAVPPQGAPRSLGLVRADGATTLVRARLLQDTAAFAVSVEPAGGSPSGAPTGPIISLGKVGT